MSHPSIPTVNQFRKDHHICFESRNDESYEAWMDCFQQRVSNEHIMKNMTHDHSYDYHSKSIQKVLSEKPQPTSDVSNSQNPSIHSNTGDAQSRKLLKVLGPDFPFAYDDYLAHSVGIGSVPESVYGTEVAIIGGGLSGIITAYELMKLGFKPVVYEAEEIGGRMRSVRFKNHPEVVAEMGAMRFPLSSVALFHYINLCELETKPFPNPLCPATPSTVIDLNGEVCYAHTLEDLPDIFRKVASTWYNTLSSYARLEDIQTAIHNRDVATIKRIWNSLVKQLDTQTFYGFLCNSPLFKSFQQRELFGQVGFGTGGWDTDFPNSILEVLRIIFTHFDDNHHFIVGGCQQLPVRLWKQSPKNMTHWPAGTTLQSLHANGQSKKAVTHLHRIDANKIVVTDADGSSHTYSAVVFTAHKWTLLNQIKSDHTLLPVDQWIAIERTHYMGSTRLCVLVDRPFWKDKDPVTGRDLMSMTLTDRLTRSTYLFDDGPARPGVICLSYTWGDDSLKWLTLSAKERLDAMLRCIHNIYPKVNVEEHIIDDPVTLSWETERNFMGAFKNNLPGQYRYQVRLFTHFMQDYISEKSRGFFIAGDDVSWTAGWAEGAVQTALNAVWGVMHHFGGNTHLDNPGPGDMFEQLAPLVLEDEHAPWLSSSRTNRTSTTCARIRSGTL
ncbi:unnamed protein product [Adineta ricciae]|uniref:Amine oxidase domain-containing protein n=1 Tax=Adineta ricciae TaxID=249248 RepID=A0A813SQD7_ADIRI|nr:unnamed protein product [Adineta ricciae]CAF1492253.1 unnamed protein product [Adineta ricciae]